VNETSLPDATLKVKVAVCVPVTAENEIACPAEPAKLVQELTLFAHEELAAVNPASNVPGVGVAVGVTV
jgi:hypothetical protein